jgi:hypothetical protein
LPQSCCCCFVIRHRRDAVDAVDASLHSLIAAVARDGVLHRSATSRADGKGMGRFYVETTWGRSFEFRVPRLTEAQEWVRMFNAAIRYWKVR